MLFKLKVTQPLFGFTWLSNTVLLSESLGLDPNKNHRELSNSADPHQLSAERLSAHCFGFTPQKVSFLIQSHLFHQPCFQQEQAAVFSKQSSDKPTAHHLCRTKQQTNSGALTAKETDFFP